MRVDPRTRAYGLLALCLLIIISGFGAALILVFDRPVSTVWPGHYTVLVSSDVAPRDAVEAMRAEGLSGVLSEATATVEIQAYGRMERVAVDRLDERLDPLDPRYDPYIRGVRTLFRVADGARSFGIYYLPVDQGIPATHRALARGIGTLTSDWAFVEWGLGRSILLVVPFLVAAAFLFRRMRRVRVPLVVTAPVWGVLVLATGTSGFLVSLGVLLSFLQWLSVSVERQHYAGFYHTNGDRNQLRRNAALFLSAWIAAGLVVFAVQEPERMGLFAVALAVTAAVGGATHVRTYLRATGSDHRLFIPVSLRPRDYDADHRAAARASVVLSALAVVTVAAASLSGFLGPPAIPQPTGRAVEPVSYSSLHRVWSNSGTMPTLADYVAHRAFQEGMMYGRRYGLPAPGEELTLSSFRRDEGVLTQEPEVVLSYDSEWLEDAVTSIDRSNVARIFVTLGGPVGVEMGPTPGLYSSLSHLLQNSALILLVLLPYLVARGYLRPRARQGLSYVALRAQRQGA
ncbi:MAG: hypothetical protein ACLFO1_03385 [Spirochaetaceae bacterium]